MSYSALLVEHLDYEINLEEILYCLNNGFIFSIWKFIIMKESDLDLFSDVNVT